MAKCKLQKPMKEVEAFVLVYHHSVKEDSELMKDLEKKYLPTITSKEKVEPRTFKQFCIGNLSKNLKNLTENLCISLYFTFRTWNSD